MVNKFFFSKKISVFQTLILVGLLTLVVFIFIKIQFENKLIYSSDNSQITESKLTIVRDSSYKFAKPLRYFDMQSPSKDLEKLREQLGTLVNNNVENGTLFQASIYLRDLENGEWTTINDNVNYHPGSLIKVPMLIYYLKESETNPSILTKQLSIDNNYTVLPNQTYKTEAIEKGKSYTVRELLKYMVSYSDNNATYLLNNNCDIDKFKKVFSDLKLPIPDVHDTNYSITIRDFSVFLRVLYNATYLTSANSDFALNLLSQSSFSLGITNKLPSNIVVARKFGEMKKENKRELHESGIIYCNNRPYMLTIMTKGYEPANLAGFISIASDTVFKFFCS